MTGELGGGEAGVGGGGRRRLKPENLAGPTLGGPYEHAHRYLAP